MWQQLWTRQPRQTQGCTRGVEGAGGTTEGQGRAGQGHRVTGSQAGRQAGKEAGTHTRRACPWLAARRPAAAAQRTANRRRSTQSAACAAWSPRSARQHTQCGDGGLMMEGGKEEEAQGEAGKLAASSAAQHTHRAASRQHPCRVTAVSPACGAGIPGQTPHTATGRGTIERSRVLGVSRCPTHTCSLQSQFVVECGKSVSFG